MDDFHGTGSGRRGLLFFPPAWILILAVMFLPGHRPQTLAEGSDGTSLRGQVLAAAPHLQDPRFAKTVIYMVRHDDTGALGLVINRPARTARFAEIFPKMGMAPPDEDGELPVYYGGPVEIHRGFLLHRSSPMPSTSRRISGDIGLTMGASLLLSIAEGSGPKDYLLAFGYAGWAPTQIEGELARGDWIVFEAEPSKVFADNPDRIWEELVRDRVMTL